MDIIPSKIDNLIVGLGISGLFSAYQLAKAGYNVVGI